MWRGGGISDLAQWRRRRNRIALEGPRLVTLISRDAALHDATGCVSDAPTTRQHRQSSNNLFSSWHGTEVGDLAPLLPESGVQRT